MNKVVLIGRLGNEPDVKLTAGNEPITVCRFPIAVDRPYSAKRTESDTTVDFINCVCFGKRGESIGQYFHKGNRIAITGRLQVSFWQDKNGQKRSSTDVIVEDFEFCENKGSSNAETTKKTTKKTTNNNRNNAPDFYPIDDDNDDILPF
nr:MAG TPA: Single strand binding protein [Bacteriophage sp.]